VNPHRLAAGMVVKGFKGLKKGFKRNERVTPIFLIPSKGCKTTIPTVAPGQQKMDHNTSKNRPPKWPQISTKSS